MCATSSSPTTTSTTPATSPRSWSTARTRRCSHRGRWSSGSPTPSSSHCTAAAGSMTDRTSTSTIAACTSCGRLRHLDRRLLGGRRVRHNMFNCGRGVGRRARPGGLARRRGDVRPPCAVPMAGHGRQRPLPPPRRTGAGGSGSAPASSSPRGTRRSCWPAPWPASMPPAPHDCRSGSASDGHSTSTRPSAHRCSSEADDSTRSSSCSTRCGAAEPRASPARNALLDLGGRQLSPLSPWTDRNHPVRIWCSSSAPLTIR